MQRSLARSHQLRARAERLIPSGTQTFSKGTTQFVQGVSPNFLSRGQGSRVWDVDGNAYLDYSMALGPLILGYNYPAVTAAVRRQLDDGTIFSLPHPLEIEVAELLIDCIPCAEMVRFGKSGSDATAGAVRVARAYTGREIIACCGYHGWQDWYVGTTTRAKGVPQAVRELTVPFLYNDTTSLERIFAEHLGNVAAVILEPCGVVAPESGFLEKVQEVTRREGALLIFDEVVTGFRLALGGAQAYFHITPDLACVGKAMANGYPLSAVVGRREVMALFDEIFFSFTFGGEALSLAAADATITELRETPALATIWERGQRLKAGCNQLILECGLSPCVACIGYPPRTVLSFTDAEGSPSLVMRSYFQQECLKHGILTDGGQMLSYSHTDADIEDTLTAYRAVLQGLADGLKSGSLQHQLEGPVVQPVFRKR